MRFVKLLLLLALAALGLAACGGQSAEPQVITEVVQIEVTRTETQIETVVETVVETVTERVVETVQVIALPAVDPLAVRGDIVTAGSSTVFPLTERMAERFQSEGFAGNGSPSTASAAARVCPASASRANRTLPTPAAPSATPRWNLAGLSAASRLSSASAPTPWPWYRQHGK
jgi:phosphate transport system substrate-binding protein